MCSPNASADRLRPYLGPLLDGCGVEQADVRDTARMEALLRIHAASSVVHAGGLGGTRVDQEAFAGFGVNVQGVLSLLEAARATGVTRTVLVSSIWVYRVQPPLPSHVAAAEDLPYQLPSTLYAAYKSAAEIAARAFARRSGMSVLNLRVAGAYGRGEFSGGGETGGLLQELVRQALKEPAGTPIPVSFRAGERVYGRDVADGLVRALAIPDPAHDVYNLGSGEIVGPAELAAAVNEAIPGARLIPQPSAAPDMPPVDLDRAALELGYVPQWPLARAIPDFVQELAAETRTR